MYLHFICLLIYYIFDGCKFSLFTLDIESDVKLQVSCNPNV